MGVYVLYVEKVEEQKVVIDADSLEEAILKFRDMYASGEAEFDDARFFYDFYKRL